MAWQTKLDSRNYYPQWVEMFYFKAFLFFLYTVFKRIDRLHEEWFYLMDFNVWVKKTWTNCSSDTLLRFVQVFFDSDVSSKLGVNSIFWKIYGLLRIYELYWVFRPLSYIASRIRLDIGCNAWILTLPLHIFKLSGQWSSLWDPNTYPQSVPGYATGRSVPPYPVFRPRP